MPDAVPEVIWPVRWEAVPEHLVEDPRLAAHRVLDRLAALGAGAVDAFVAALAELNRALTDPAFAVELVATPHAAAVRARVTVRPGDGQTAGSTDGTPEPIAGPTTGSIDRRGTDALESLAFRLAGHPAAALVRRLVAAASSVDGAGFRATGPGDAAFLADVATLAGSSEPVSAAWSDVAALPAAAPSRCELLFRTVDAEDLDANPPPEGTAFSTAGIERVAVDQPCGAAPVMTIHGTGLLAARGTTEVMVATWDVHNGGVVYGQVPASSWSDTAVVAPLPDDVISGTAAFADLDYLREYDTWVKGRNARVAARMRASGCPGAWPVEGPLADTPAGGPASAYTAGLPRVIATVAPTTGAAEHWNAQTLHLQIGQMFDIGWQSFNADAVVLLPLDAGASGVVAAAGGSDAGLVLAGAGGNLVLTASATPARASFGVEVHNPCGTTRAPLQVMITGPALQPASLSVFQPLAGGDVKVTTGAAGEVLDPATGSSIPLVAGKRSVAVVDWWTAVPQLPPGEQLTAVATLEVSGPLVGEIGITLQASVSTSDAAPPEAPLELPSGPGFTSLAAYQQWIAAGNEPRTFTFVLPAQVCLGGPIPGLSVQGWTVLGATVTVTSTDGPAWTLTPGNNVTFYPRRKVRIKYRAWGTPTQTAPTDSACQDALRGAGSLLPIPDPEIVALSGSPVQSDGHLIEDLVAERGGAPTDPDSWRDEIWLMIGPVGVGGYSPGPWVGASDATALTCAHEIGHLFGQNHLALCGLVGDDPASFPNGGNVVVPGLDMWNPRVVRNALDIMVRTYCPEPTWPSPERWRRIFLQAGSS